MKSFVGQQRNWLVGSLISEDVNFVLEGKGTTNIDWGEFPSLAVAYGIVIDHGLSIEGALDPWIEQLIVELLELYPCDDSFKVLPQLGRPPPRVKTVYVPAETESTDPLDADQKYWDVTVQCNRRITAEDWFQDVRHFEFLSERCLEWVNVSSVGLY